jgi:sulfatase maturation enzyme AslB (radical SAM superfamily)
MNKPLCYAPFLNLYATGHNRVAPCCVATRSNLSPQNYWNSDELKEIRIKLLANEFPSICSYCKVQSNKGLPTEKDLWDKEFNKDPVKIDIITGNDTGNPLYLDYRPSHVCNLKCRMCNPYTSTLLEKEVKDNPELLEWMPLPTDTHIDGFDDFVSYINQMSFKKVKILGGEPSIEEKAIRFLEKLDKKIPLHITTNGTNLNKKFQSTLKIFNDLSITFSIDGTGKTYEYIRTNANWNKTSRYIQAAITNKIAKNFCFNIVLTPYNIFDMINLLKWTQQFKDVRLFIVESEFSFTSLSAVHPEDIDDLLRYLYKNPNYELIDILENVTFDDEIHKNFVRYNNTLDRIRKTKLTDLDPRFEKYI